MCEVVWSILTHDHRPTDLRHHCYDRSLPRLAPDLRLVQVVAGAVHSGCGYLGYDAAGTAQDVPTDRATHIRDDDTNVIDGAFERETA